MLCAVYVGLALGRATTLIMVRAVAWWVSRVILPLLRSPSWWRRAGTIFINNILILAGLVALGPRYLLSIVGIACVGLSMGIALRVLLSLPDAFSMPGSRSSRRIRRAIRIGLLMNLLEPPAIVAALGLSLNRQASQLSDLEAWTAFGVWVAPAMLLAAGGEALWIGAGREARQTQIDGPSDSEKPVNSPSQP